MPITKHHKSKLALQHANAQEIVVRIGVEKSDSHHLSQNEQGGDNPCYQQLHAKLAGHLELDATRGGCE